MPFGKSQVKILNSKNHLITRSAIASTLGGIVNPIALAAFRLITSSNFVGCSTGRSAGLAPVGHEPSGLHELPLGMHHRQPALVREGCKLALGEDGTETGQHQDGVWSPKD